MMIINHVTEGMISDHVQNVIRFVIRFKLYLFGKGDKCSKFYLGPLRGTEPIDHVFCLRPK